MNDKNYWTHTVSYEGDIAFHKTKITLSGQTAVDFLSKLAEAIKENDLTKSTEKTSQPK